MRLKYNENAKEMKEVGKKQKKETSQEVSSVSGASIVGSVMTGATGESMGISGDCVSSG